MKTFLAFLRQVCILMVAALLLFLPACQVTGRETPAAERGKETLDATLSLETEAATLAARVDRSGVLTF
jgi:hypothetical protein